MKRKIWMGVGALLLFGGILWASDHGDAPAVGGKPTDITDIYAFESPENSSDMVFIGNVQGLLSPSATGAASFDPNTMIEFNIDNTGDNVEDLVIQCVPTNGKMYVYGPVEPAQPGTTSKVTGTASVIADITPYSASSPSITSKGGIKVFAGSRDDPFFFDVGQYVKIVTGEATGFVNPGVDALAGTNVLSVVVQLPKSKLNSTGTINVWLETKQKK